MSLVKSKYIRRGGLITLGGISSLFPALSGATVSYLIISQFSAILWGGVVFYLVLLEISFSFISWGNRPYLLREFSINPAKISSLWKQSLLSRSVVLVIFLIALWIWQFDNSIKLWLSLWAIGRFLYQSFEVLIQYHRHFITSIVVEFLGLFTIITLILTAGTDLTIADVLMFNALTVGLKALILLAFYFNTTFKAQTVAVDTPGGRPSTSPLISAFPFFLVGFAGMLQSRADLYIVSALLDNTILAHYQVYLNFLIFSQVFASILLRPFSKNIFRLGDAATQKLERRYITAGLVITMLTTVFIYVIITFLYRFNLSITLYLLGYGYVVVYYLYQIRAYVLGRNYQQHVVAKFGLVAGVVNLAGSYLLIPVFSIEGALAAGFFSQIVMAAGLHAFRGKGKNNPKP